MGTCGASARSVTRFWIFCKGRELPKALEQQRVSSFHTHSRASIFSYRGIYSFFEAFVDVAKRSAYIRLTSNKHL